MIKATGRFQTSAKEIHVGFTRSIFPTPPAAYASVGFGTDVDFAGSQFEIDGNNWVPPDGSNPAYVDNNACGPGTGPKFGVAVRDAEQQVLLKKVHHPAKVG